MEPAFKPFYTYKDDDSGQEFHFRRPTVSELDRMTSKVKTAALTVAMDTSKSLALEGSKEAWSAFIDEFPGAASTVMSEVMALLKFRQG